LLGTALAPSLILFIVASGLRAIPEIMVGKYPIGSDTMTFYAPYVAKFRFDLLNMFFWGHLTSWSLMKSIYAVLGDPYITLKIVGSLSYGFLVVSFYDFLSSSNWSRGKSFVISLFALVQIPMLRLPWDLFHNVLGLSFMFLALSQLAKIRRSENGSHLAYVKFAVLSVLTALTHQMTFFILVIITTFCVMEILLRKNRDLQIQNLVKSLSPSLCLFALIVTLPKLVHTPEVNPFRIFYKESLMEQAATSYLVNYLGFLNYSEILNRISTTFVVAFAPLIPFILVGYRQTKLPFILRIFTGLALIFTFSPILSGVSLFHWDRWMWLLVFPFCVYAFAGICVIHERIQKLRLRNILKRLARTLFVLGVVVSFLFLCFMYTTRPKNDPFIFYGNLPSMWYLPETMQKTTISFEYIPDLENCVKWLDSNIIGNSTVLFESPLTGFVLLNLSPRDDVTLISYYPREFTSVLRESLDQGFDLIYLIWYTEYRLPSADMGIDFFNIHNGGNFSVFLRPRSFQPLSLEENETLIRFGNGTYVEVADNSSVRPSLFTVEFWAKPSSFGKWNRWMGKSLYTSAVKSGWEIMWTDDVDNPSICLAMWDEHNAERRSHFVGTKPNEWTHVAFAFNGSHIFSFRNGRLNGTVGVGDWRFSASLELLRVGRAFDGSLYNGLFASLRFYNRSLSSYEIAHNLFGNGTRDGLVLEFDFIDNGSLFLPDMSGLGNDGRISFD
jgi:hypothetical protein